MEFINPEKLRTEHFTKAYDKTNASNPSILKEFGRPKPVGSNIINLVRSDKKVQVLEPAAKGNPNAPIYKDEDKKPVNLYRFPYETTITQEELGKVILNSGKLSPVKLAELTTEHMDDHKDNRLETLIHMAYGAIKGKLLSGKGMPLQDYYSLFDLTKKEFTLNLYDQTEDVPSKLLELFEHLEKVADGSKMQYDGIKSRIDRDSIARILSHKSVLEEGGELAKANLMQFRNKPKEPIELFGITFVPDNAPQLKNDGSVYPSVLKGLFSMVRYTPPLMGKQRATGDGTVLSIQPGPHDEYQNIQTTSHNLAICHDPTLLVGLKTVKTAPN